MMVLEDLKDQIPLREISRISGIPLSFYYYRPRERHIQRLDPTIRNKIREIASERPTYGYRRVWAVLRNSGTHVNQKTVRKVLRDSNLSLPACFHDLALLLYLVDQGKFFLCLPASSFGHCSPQTPFNMVFNILISLLVNPLQSFKGPEHTFAPLLPSRIEKPLQQSP